MKKYWVVDEANLTSWSSDSDGAEGFENEASALERAEDLAASSPGENFFICEAISVTRCDVAKPVTVVG